MRKIALWFIPLAVIAAGCSGDDIDVVEGDSSITVNCTELNSDLKVLQGLITEINAGSTVYSFSDGTIAFSSGTIVTVKARDAYSFSYYNPVVGASGGYWTLDSDKLSVKVEDELVQVKGSDSKWYVYYNSVWNEFSEIEEGTSVPVFSSVSQASDGSVTVVLGSGSSYVIDAYSGSTSLVLSESSIAFDAEGGTASVSISANSEWTATAAADWITLVSPSSGSASDNAVSVSISVDANEAATRSSYVNFVSDEISIKLIVTQTGVTSISEAGGVIDTGDTEDSDDNIANTTWDRTITITYSSSGASVSGDVNGIVNISGSDVTVKNNDSSNASYDEKIIYKLTGSTSDGFFKLYSSRKQAIYLDGVSITNKNGAAINNQSKKRTFVVVEGTNTLKDGTSYSDTPSDEDEKAAFFSEGQLVFCGSGTLTVTATGKAGITSDDYVRFMSSPTVTVSSSAGHGLRGKDAVYISNGNLSVSTSASMKKGISSDSLVCVTGGVTNVKVTGAPGYDSDDSEYKATACIKADRLFLMSGGEVTLTNTGQGGKGLRAGSEEITSIETSEISGGTLTITTSGSYYSKGDKSPKGIKVGWKSSSGSGMGSSSTGYGDLVISGGTVNVTTTGSYGEGIEAKGNMTFSGGNVVSVSSQDDAINAAGKITFSGANVYAYASSNDAIDSNYGKSGAITISGGVVIAHGTTSPEEGFDCDNNSYIVFKGGTVFSSGGAQGGGTSSSPSCSVPVHYLQGYSLGSGYFTVTNSSTKEIIMAVYVPKSISQCCSFISSSKFSSGTTYAYGVTSSAPSGTTSGWGKYFYTGGTASVSAGTWTAGSGYTTSGSSNGGGGTAPGGPGGRR